MIEAFVNRIKELRSNKKLTQENLAQALNLTREAIASYEAGNTTPPAEVFLQLADFYGVSLDYLFGRSPYPHQGYYDLVGEKDVNHFRQLYSLSEEERKLLLELSDVIKKSTANMIK